MVPQVGELMGKIIMNMLEQKKGESIMIKQRHIHPLEGNELK